ncbi:MAG: hypothetical protein N2C13_01730, partial [Chloroflexota bacterium]
WGIFANFGQLSHRNTHANAQYIKSYLMRCMGLYRNWIGAMRGAYMCYGASGLSSYRGTYGLCIM